MTKMTKRNFYEAMINFANGGNFEYNTEDGVVAVTDEMIRLFGEHEIQLLDKKADKAKATAKAKNAATDALTDAVAAVLNDELQTIADVTAQIEGEDVTTSKVQYRLNALVKAGQAEKEEVTLPAAEGKKARKVMAYRLVG